MKKILFALALVFTTQDVLSQELPINETTGKVTYEDIVKLEGIEKDVLYIRANEWFAKTFKLANAVIQVQDKEAGKIIGRGSISVTNLGYDYGVFEFTLSFTAKEGRYKYVITDIRHDKSTATYGGTGGAIENEKPDCGTFLMFKKQWKSLKSKADKELKFVSNDLVEYMSRVDNSDEDW